MEKKSTNPAQTEYILRVALPVPMYRCFDYLYATRVAIGCRVRVPFGRGNRIRIGVVVAHPTRTQNDAQQLKRIEKAVDPQPLMPMSMFKLLQWCAYYYFHPIGDVLLGVLPKHLRDGKPATFAQHVSWVLQKRTELPPRGVRQRQALALLERKPMTTPELKQAGLSIATLNQLAKTGWIEKKTGEVMPVRPVNCIETPNFQPNTEQQQAIDALQAHASCFQVFLLEGVTGSGKTEVYIQAMLEQVKQEKQVLILVPEISLTSQTLSRFRQRTGAQVVSLHSGMSDRERLNTWLLCAKNNAQVLIGTRSALFTPMPKLGLIIIDEEHDASYKQQDGFRYHARDVAIMCAKQHNIPILLGSATPSLETLNHCIQGKYQHLKLTKRAGVAQLPEQITVDLKGLALEAGLSPHLLQLMQHHLQAQQQVLLFLNRRGWAPSLLCHQCGWQAVCDACDHGLTWHQKQQKLVCHRCQHQQKKPIVCPSCRSSELINTGLGTEQLEDTLTRLFPNNVVTRIDRDSVTNAQQLHQLLDTVKQGQPQILVGTQMLAKGHHFPYVTLVALMDVDAALFSSDYRAIERFSQLYTQVAGRSGRARYKGRVVLQTHHPEHPMLQMLLERGYPHLAQQMLIQRQELNLPPSTFQAVLRADSRQHEQAQAFLLYCQQILIQSSPNIECIGPLPAIHAKRAGRVRYCLILNASSRERVHNVLRQYLPQIIEQSRRQQARYAIDIDPMDYT